MIATLLKAELGHGKWLPFLREHGYVEARSTRDGTLLAIA